MSDMLSMDDLIAGLQAGGGPIDISKVGGTMEGVGHWYHSLWYSAGMPGAGVAPSSGVNGLLLTSDPNMVAGQIPFVKAAAGNVKRLARFEADADRAGSLLLLDRLWANSGLSPTTTTSQSITPTALPPRDANGNTDGVDVRPYVEVSTVTGNGSPITTVTITYTNESGVGGRTGTIPSFPATAVAGTLVPFMLQAGDRGVRSIQAFNLGGTSLVSGAIHLVLARRLGALRFRANGDGFDKSFDLLGIPRLYDGSVPFLAWVARDTTAVNIMAGTIQYAER